jgi:predicted ATPase/DNA-binding SARP family transcriptional activator
VDVRVAVPAAQSGYGRSGRDTREARADGQRVRIGLLGPLAVHDDAGRPVRVGGQRVRALLTLLALDANRVVPSSALIDRLWGDDANRPADAANALQSLVSRLRAALREGGADPAVIESSPVGYRLAIEPEAVDAIAFERTARAGARALAAGDASQAARLLRDALATWRGPALADVAEEDFAAATAARLEEARLSATLDRIEADLALGDSAAGPGELRAITTADPLAERPRALLMRALAVSGRQAEALATYHDFRERLADELGVDPSPALEQVYLGILRHDVIPARRGPEDAAPGDAGEPGEAANPAGSVQRSHTTEDEQAGARLAGRQPPGGADGSAPLGQRQPSTAAGPALNSFVGRDDDVSGVLKKLGEHRLVTLTGPGGVGKTRLATEVTARVGSSALFAELAPVTDPARVPYAVLGALGTPDRVIARQAADAGDPMARLTDALAGQDVALVLDNCEHVIDAAAALAARMLADCPRVTIIATSREPLRISGEALWPVAPLPVPPEADAPATIAAAPPAPGGTGGAGPGPGEGVPGTAPDIARYPAVRLLRDRVVVILPDFEVDAGNAAAVARLCRALDGMPLAIELAAPWLRTLTPHQLAERLDDRFALLTGGSRTALPRHQTLRAVVDWSWELMSPAERALARRLAVFPAGATLEAIEQVCADHEAAAAGQPGTEDRPGTAGRLPRAAVLLAVSGLVSKSVLTVADGPPARYRMLETIRAYGLERLADAGEELSVKDAFARYYLELAEAADPALRTREQVPWYRALRTEQDNMHAALRWAIARGDAGTALRIVRSLGYYWVQVGHGEGDALARAVLAMPVPEGGPGLRIAEARVICALIAAGWTWDIELVREPLTAAIARLEQGWGTDYAAYHPLVALADPIMALYDGDSDRALRQFERYMTVPDPWMRAMARVYRASYLSNLGQMDGVEADCRTAVEEFRALGDKWGMALALAQLAEFTELHGDHDASIAVLEESAAIGRDLGAWGDLPYIQGRLATIRARAGDLAAAWSEWERAERAAAGMGGYTDSSRWLGLMRAEIAWRAGDLADVTRCCTEVLGALRDTRAAWWQGLRAQVKALLAMVAHAQGDAGQARQLLTEALAAGTGWVERPPLAIVINAVAAVVVSGDPQRAATLLGAAHAVRGAFDEGSPDAGSVRAAARAQLGDEAFQAAYQRGRDLGHEGTLALVQQTLAP